MSGDTTAGGHHGDESGGRREGDNEVEHLVAKIDSQRRWIGSLEDRLTMEREQGAVRRVLGVGCALATVALFLPWRHDADTGPNDWNALLGIGAGATVAALLVAVGVFTATSSANSFPVIVFTSAIALTALCVGVVSAWSDDRHAPLGPGPLLASLGCATLLTGGVLAREIDRRPNR